MDLKVCWKLLFLCVLAGLAVAGRHTAAVEAGTEKAAGISEGKIEQQGGGRNLDVILLNNQGYKKKKKGPVEFTHKKHAYDYKFLCWDCHHDYKEEQNIWVPWGETRECSQCHDPKNKESNKIMLQKAFHLQCKGCHRDLLKIGRKAGEDRKCGGCHGKMENR